MAEQEKVLYEAPLRDGEVLRASLSTYQGREYIQLRVWFLEVGSGEMRPGKGLAVLSSQFGLVVEGVRALHAHLKARQAAVPAEAAPEAR